MATMMMMMMMMTALIDFDPSLMWLSVAIDVLPLHMSPPSPPSFVIGMMAVAVTVTVTVLMSDSAVDRRCHILLHPFDLHLTMALQVPSSPIHSNYSPSNDTSYLHCLYDVCRCSDDRLMD